MERPEIRPFTVAVPDAVLDDLKARLDRTRFAGALGGPGWQYGTDAGYLCELVEYWATTYDWRAAEAALNELPQYMATVDGNDLHFVHVPGKGPNPVPLLFSHGWPGSFWEVAKIIGPLTDPAAYGGDVDDSFTVVAPSLPGYGFSPDAALPGMHPGKMADLFAGLMSGVLGYERFGAQGGDWGATILTRLAHAHPERLIGLHLNLVMSVGQVDAAPPLTVAEAKFVDDQTRWGRSEGGYAVIQGTKPQTLAFGLNDSPAGLAAWIVEKFRRWSDCDGEVERVFSKDELLTNIMIYWVTGCIGSSMRLYYERDAEGWRMGAGERIPVPTAYARFPAEGRQPPPEWLERMFDLRRFTDMPRGGHFAALEQPDLLVTDLREFFRPLRGG